MEPEMAALRALGLTEYGARAYRALVALGPTDATTLASAAPLPRTKVYAVLADLARRGWAEAEGGRPRRYRARPPEECFTRERARLGAVLDAALPTLQAHHRERSTRFAGPLWILDGADVVAQRALEMVRAARREATLLASFPLPGDEKAMPRALREAHRRGVRVRLAAPDLAAPHARALAFPGAEVRTAAVPPRLLLVDDRQALMALPAPRPEGGAHVKGIWNPAPELLELMGVAVSGVWTQAAPPEEERAARTARTRPGAPRPQRHF